MTPRVRAMVGAMTTLLFCGMGAFLLAEGGRGVGGLLLALGLFRGLVLLRQVQGMVTSDDAPPSDPGPPRAA